MSRKFCAQSVRVLYRLALALVVWLTAVGVTIALPPTKVSADALDIGSAAIDRATSGLDNWTQIDLNNWIDGDGTITSVDIYCDAWAPSGDVKIGTFYEVEGETRNVYKCRDVETVSSLVPGLNTKAVTITAQAGDYIGYFTDDDNGFGNVEVDSSGGWSARISGDHAVVDDQQTYTPDNDIYSLHGTGTGTISLARSYFRYAGASGSRGYVNHSNHTLSTGFSQVGNLSGTLTSAFIRFDGIVIPDGATIDTAWIRLVGSQGAGIATMDTIMYFEDSADPGAPATEADYNGRALTTATVVNWRPTWTNSTQYYTPSLVDIIQELVDAYDYTDGAAMIMMWKNNGSASDEWLQDHPDMYVELWIEFTQAPDPPTVSTTGSSAVTYTTATMEGNITDIGGANCTTRGFQYDTDSGAPYAFDTHEDGSFGVGAFSLGVIGLNDGVTYYFRAYVTNPGSTTYGSELTFVTGEQDPTVTTQNPTSLTMDKDGLTGGTFHGNLTNLGDDTEADVSFQWGLTTDYLGGETTPETKLVIGAFTASLPTDLVPGSVYHSRAKAVNSHGTAYGVDQAFTLTMPSFTTAVATYTSPGVAEATLKGNISNLNVASDCYGYFEWGYDTTYSESTAPQTLSITGDFTQFISGFQRNTNIYYRAVIEVGATTSSAHGRSFLIEPPAPTERLLYQPITIVVNRTASGVADAGTPTTLLDAALVQADDYWNFGVLTITDTTNDLAPKGETAVISDFGSGLLTFPALTAGVDVGDTYSLELGIMPDRDGGDQDGLITWGTALTANPGTIELGELPTVTGLPPIDILPEAEGSDWFVEPDIPTALTNNPFRPIVTLLSDNTELTEIQSWRFLGLVFVLFVTVTTGRFIREHLFIVGLACGAAILILVVMTIWPLWALVFVAGAVGAGLVAERTPSL